MKYAQKSSISFLGHSTQTENEALVALLEVETMGIAPRRERYGDEVEILCLRMVLKETAARYGSIEAEAVVGDKRPVHRHMGRFICACDTSITYCSKLLQGFPRVQG
jgi:hypothetical protein